MALKSHRLDALAQFLPSGAYPLVLKYLRLYPVQLSITKSRATKYGDYSFHTLRLEHKITINGNLNVYEFLITLLHELAHLITFVQYKNKVAPHGEEWKNNYRFILTEFINTSIFPISIQEALINHMNNLKASHCHDPILTKVLHQFNPPSELVFINELNIGSQFKTDKNEIFEILEKRRTRYRCQSLSNKKIYLFPGLFQVKPIEK